MTSIYSRSIDDAEIWIVAYRENGRAEEDRFKSKEDAEVFRRTIDGPELWELTSGPVIWDRTYFGAAKSIERYTVYYMSDGKRGDRTFGDRETASAFRAHLMGSAPKATARRSRRAGRTPAEFNDEVRAMVRGDGRVHTREDGSQ